MQNQSMRAPGWLLLLSFVGFPLVSARAADWKSVYPDLKNSIPILFSQGVCSGALISPQLILTASHCVDKLRRTFVMWPDEPGKYTEVETILIKGAAQDLALVRLPRPSTRKPMVVLEAAAELKPGQEVATIGHPTMPKPFSNPPIDLDSTYLISTGVISRVGEKDLISDLSLSPGNSGGPVVDDQGRIVGVVSRKRIDQFVGNIGYIPHHKKIQAMLTENSTELLTRPAVSKWKASWGMGVHLGYTVHTVMPSLGASGNGLWTIGADLDLLDRVRLLGSVSVFDSTTLATNYGVGYKFEFVCTKSMYRFWVTPSFERWIYSLPQGSRGFLGAGLSLASSFSPLDIKGVALSVDGRAEWAVTFALSGRF